MNPDNNLRDTLLNAGAVATFAVCFCLLWAAEVIAGGRQ